MIRTTAGPALRGDVDDRRRLVDRDRLLDGGRCRRPTVAAGAGSSSAPVALERDERAARGEDRRQERGRDDRARSPPSGCGAGPARPAARGAGSNQCSGVGADGASRLGPARRGPLGPRLGGAARTSARVVRLGRRRRRIGSGLVGRSWVACTSYVVRPARGGERLVTLRQPDDSRFRRGAAVGEESATFGGRLGRSCGRRPGRSAADRGGCGRPSTPRIARQEDRERRARPEPALDRDRAAVHVDDRADDRQAEAAAAAARLVGPRAAVEPLEDPRQLARVDADAGVGRPRSGRRRGSGETTTSTEPPRGVNLIALPTRLVDDLADPLRVVADPERRVRQRQRAGRRRAGGPPASPARRPIRRPPAGRPAGGRAGRARSRASRARAGSGRASRGARAGRGSTRGTRRGRPGRRRPAP